MGNWYDIEHDKSDNEVIEIRDKLAWALLPPQRNNAQGAAFF